MDGDEDSDGQGRIRRQEHTRLTAYNTIAVNSPCHPVPTGPSAESYSQFTQNDAIIQKY
jgi:hypothetical protein